jgi:hypothetical protein
VPCKSPLKASLNFFTLALAIEPIGTSNGSFVIGLPFFSFHNKRQQYIKGRTGLAVNENLYIIKFIYSINYNYITNYN